MKSRFRRIYETERKGLYSLLHTSRHLSSGIWCRRIFVHTNIIWCSSNLWRYRFYLFRVKSNDLKGVCFYERNFSKSYFDFCWRSKYNSKCFYICRVFNSHRYRYSYWLFSCIWPIWPNFIDIYIALYKQGYNSRQT